MMSNACQVGVRKPEASNGAMNMSRYISKSVLLLTLSLVICCGLYTLSLSVIGQAIFPFQANSSMLTGPDSKVVGSRQSAQPFTKDEYFQPRPSAASYDASASTCVGIGCIEQHLPSENRDFGVAEDSIVTAPNSKGLPFLRLLTIVGAARRRHTNGVVGPHSNPPCSQMTSWPRRPHERFVNPRP